MSNKKANYSRSELEDAIKHCEYVISKTKSYKCKNDHVKALNCYKKELKFYDDSRER